MCGPLGSKRTLLRHAEDGETGKGEVGGEAREGGAKVQEMEGAEGLKPGQ